jgi:hypothetical protein
MVKIIFFDWDTFYGRVIKDITHSDWSHCGIISDETETDYTVHEAISKGLVKSAYTKEFINSKIKDGTCQIKELWCYGATKEQVQAICKIYEGYPYDWTSIFYIALSILFRRNFVNKSAGAREVICSEFVARVLFDVSNKMVDLPKYYGKYDFDYITPGDIWNFSEKKGKDV